MSGPASRRPLASRQTAWAQAATRRLAATSVTPNQISMAGMVAALIAFLCFWLAPQTGVGRTLLLIIAALMIQGRLLCNLLDGMVAVEAGRGSPDGGFWNEFPDRVSDLLILLGAGLYVGDPALGWAAVSMAFLTAYVRELGVNCGAAADFSGPMAKPHRMALITGAAVLSLFEVIWGWNGQIMTAALWVAVIGTAFTALRRAANLVRLLNGR